MAADSRQRKDAWLKTGCNAFDGKRPMSKPLSIWTTQDVYRYTRDYKLPYCPIYGEITEEIKISPKRKIQRKTGRLITTGEAYRRLAKLLNIPIKECHFGWFDKDALYSEWEILDEATNTFCEDHYETGPCACCEHKNPLHCNRVREHYENQHKKRCKQA